MEKRARKRARQSEKERARAYRRETDARGLTVDGGDRPGLSAGQLPPREWARRLLVYGRLAALGLPLFGRLDDEAYQPSEAEVDAYVAAHWTEWTDRARPRPVGRMAVRVLGVR